MAYSQSYSVVAYLLETYGQERLQELVLTLAAGEGYDEALEQVYGVNVDQLELAWREAIGAPSRPLPPTATPLLAAAVPTVAPLMAAQDVPTPIGLEQTPVPGRTGDSTSGSCFPGLLPLLFGPLLLLRVVGGRGRIRPDSAT